MSNSARSFDNEQDIATIITTFGAPIIRDDFENKIGRYEHRLCVERISRLVPRNAKVLDAGCGAGYSTAYLSLLRPDITIVGYDVYLHPTWKHLSRANLRFLVVNGDKLPFRNEEFDFIVSFGVMEHTANERVFLRELNRVLRRGGMNVLTHLPNAFSVNEFLAKVTCRPHHEKKYCKPNIRFLLNSNGFTLRGISVDYVVPLQVYKISTFAKRVFDRYYRMIFAFDRILVRTPLKFFGQSFTVVSEKA